MAGGPSEVPQPARTVLSTSEPPIPRVTRSPIDSRHPKSGSRLHSQRRKKDDAVTVTSVGGIPAAEHETETRGNCPRRASSTRGRAEPPRPAERLEHDEQSQLPAGRAQCRANAHFSSSQHRRRLGQDGGSRWFRVPPVHQAPSRPAFRSAEAPSVATARRPMSADVNPEASVETLKGRPSVSMERSLRPRIDHDVTADERVQGRRHVRNRLGRANGSSETFSMTSGTTPTI